MLWFTYVTVFIITNTDVVIKNTYSDRRRANICDRLSYSIRNSYAERHFTIKKDYTTSNPAVHKITVSGKAYNLNEDNGVFVDHTQEESIDAMIAKLKRATARTIFPQYFWNSSLEELTKILGAAARRRGKPLRAYANLNTYLNIRSNVSNWQLVHRDVTRFALYNPENPALHEHLQDLATKEITNIGENDGGTQFKMVFHYADGGRAIFKPMRYSRNIEANPNHFVFDDLERHVAEIAAFHLDRILGFYRVPPTIGRRVNLTSEIQPRAPRKILDTFFISPAGNKCVYGVCDLYCDSAHAFCGNPDMLEGSVQSYLPSEKFAPRVDWWQPWKRAYMEDGKADWETNDTYCETVRHKAPFNNGKLLLDMIDAHTFDFLTGNKDRHSFETFEEFGNYSFPVLYDNGRGFGRQDYDAMSILTPLRQCCMIRKSTFLKYVKLYTGPYRLSALMERSLASDPVAPVLLPGHLQALDRRVQKILLTVAKCLESGMPATSVIIADNF